MKSITFFPLYHHYFKYVGLLFSLIGLALVLFLDPHYELLLYSGLLIMVFSKEKNESEASGLIRSEVFKTVFGFTLSLAIALHITKVLSESFEFEMTVFLGIGLPLLLYLLIFYIVSIFRIKVDSSQDFAENLKNHRRFYFIWFIIAVAISGVLILKITNVI